MAADMPRWKRMKRQRELQSLAENTKLAPQHVRSLLKHHNEYTPLVRFTDPAQQAAFARDMGLEDDAELARMFADLTAQTAKQAEGGGSGDGGGDIGSGDGGSSGGSGGASAGAGEAAASGGAAAASGPAAANSSGASEPFGGDMHSAFEFVEGVSMLGTISSPGDQVRFLFQFYDTDGDGKLSRELLSRMLLDHYLPAKARKADPRAEQRLYTWIKREWFSLYGKDRQEATAAELAVLADRAPDGHVLRTMTLDAADLLLKAQHRADTRPLIKDVASDWEPPLDLQGSAGGKG